MLFSSDAAVSDIILNTWDKFVFFNACLLICLKIYNRIAVNRQCAYSVLKAMHLNNEVLTFKLCFNLGEFVIYRSSINQLFFKVDSVAFLVGV